jgi:hypothetical protein
MGYSGEEYVENMKSLFHEGFFQIQRLHYDWLKTQAAREKGNFLRLRWLLDSITIELWNDAIRLDKETTRDEEIKKDPEKGERIMILRKIDEDISKAFSAHHNETIYKLLMDKEKFLKRIQEESGKGSKLIDSGGDFEL